MTWRDSCGGELAPVVASGFSFCGGFLMCRVQLCCSTKQGVLSWYQWRQNCLKSVNLVWSGYHHGGLPRMLRERNVWRRIPHSFSKLLTRRNVCRTLMPVIFAACWLTQECVVELPSTKFHENPHSGFWVVGCGQTEGNDKLKSIPVKQKENKNQNNEIWSK